VLSYSEDENKGTYQFSDLQGDYTISFKFTSNNTEDLASKVTIAGGLKGIYSDETIRERYLDTEDPIDEKRKIDAETLDREDPIIHSYRQLHALIDEAKTDPRKDIEARIMLNKVINLIKRTQLDLNVPLANEPNKKEPYTNTNPLAAIMNQGGGGGGGIPQEENLDE
jgi:hypothetical protein